MTPEQWGWQIANKWYHSEFWQGDDVIRRALASLAASTIHAAVTEAVAGEREACAVVADDLALIRTANDEGYIVAAMIATEIRARSRGEGENG